LAGDDPVKIDQYFKLPLWEYWSILNQRLAILNEEKEKAKKKKY
jgi:hypothetical protein